MSDFSLETSEILNNHENRGDEVDKNLDSVVGSAVRETTSDSQCSQGRDDLETQAWLLDPKNGLVPLMESLSMQGSTGDVGAIEAAEHVQTPALTLLEETLSAEESAPDVETMHAEGSAPDVETMPAEESAPDVETMPAEESALDKETMPAEESAPDETMHAEESACDVETMHAEESALDVETMPAEESAPDVETMHAEGSAPDVETMHAEESTLPAEESTRDVETMLEPKETLTMQESTGDEGAMLGEEASKPDTFVPANEDDLPLPDRDVLPDRCVLPDPDVPFVDLDVKDDGESLVAVQKLMVLKPKAKATPKSMPHGRKVAQAGVSKPDPPQGSKRKRSQALPAKRDAKKEPKKANKRDAKKEPKKAKAGSKPEPKKNAKSKGNSEKSGKTETSKKKDEPKSSSNKKTKKGSEDPPKKGDLSSEEYEKLIKKKLHSASWRNLNLNLEPCALANLEPRKVFITCG